jgi:hypothetical protein
MRRRLAYVLAWSLATAVAVTGSWVGLQPLLAAATPQLPASLSASQLRDAAPGPSPSASLSASPSPSPAPPPPPVTPPPQLQLPASSQWERVGDHYERTFVVGGGEVVFHASREDVGVVWHTANPGYQARVNRWTRGSVIFSFESTERTSRIWVMWRNGPYAEVTESV